MVQVEVSRASIQALPPVRVEVSRAQFGGLPIDTAAAQVEVSYVALVKTGTMPLVAAIAPVTVEPGAEFVLQAAPDPTGVPPTGYRWSQIDGPPLRFNTAGTVQRIVAPSIPPPADVARLAVAAIANGLPGPERIVEVTVLPQTDWTRVDPDEEWIGATGPNPVPLPPDQPPTPPPAPNPVTLTGISEPLPRAVRIDWTPAPPADEVVRDLVYESRNPASPVAIITNGATFRQSGQVLFAGQRYEYWVVREVDGVPSIESNHLTITLAAPPPTEPPPDPAQPVAFIKYERLGPPMASDDSPIPAGWPDWRKVRILSQTTYTVDDGPVVNFTSGISMPAGSNNVVFLPRGIAMQRIGGLTLGGGHSLSVRNGEVNHVNPMSDANYWGLNMPPNGTTVHNQSARKGMQFNQQTGDVYAEGLLIQGPQLNDCIWPNSALTTITGRKRFYTFQNCLFTGARQPNAAAQFGNIDPATGVDWSQNELHADAMQVIGNGTNTVVRLFQCLLESAYQGIMDNMGDGCEFELERCHFNMVLSNADGSRTIGYTLFTGGPVRIGPEVTVRNPPRFDGLGQQRQVGFPETVSKWAGIEQIVTTTRADPAWRATAWVGDQHPGRGYVARATVRP